MFKQKLTCLRMPGQPADFDNESLTQDKKEALATVPGENKPISPEVFPNVEE